MLSDSDDGGPDLLRTSSDFENDVEKMNNSTSEDGEFNGRKGRCKSGARGVKVRERQSMDEYVEKMAKIISSLVDVLRNADTEKEAKSSQF